MSLCSCVKTHARYARPGYRSSRAGLTLLELIVVLGILALLAGVAVQSLDPIANQSRYEATQSVLNQVRSGIVGDPLAINANNQRILSGFIADTGVLPTGVSDLLQQPVGLSAVGVQQFDSDRDATNDVSLTRGWNGPYLQLGAGRNSVLDGWGHALHFSNNSGVLTIASYGSDDDSVAPETGYQADVAVTIPLNAYQGDLVFHLYAIAIPTGSRIDATEANLLDGISSPPPNTKRLGVMLYAKNVAGGTNGDIEELLCPVNMTGSFEYRLSNAIAGKAAARAVFWDDANNDQLLNLGETVLRKSCVMNIDIVPGRENRFDMELR